MNQPTQFQIAYDAKWKLELIHMEIAHLANQLLLKADELRNITMPTGLHDDESDLYRIANRIKQAVEYDVMGARGEIIEIVDDNFKPTL